MLRRIMRQQEPKGQNEPFTYVHRGTTIIGDLEATGRVRVHGTIRGNVRVNGVLEVAEAGRIEGDLVEADEVKIIGQVRANVHTRGKIEIWKAGRLEGDVRASALDIEEGASFTGRSEMEHIESERQLVLVETEPDSLGAFYRADGEPGDDIEQLEKDQNPALS